MKSFNFEKGLYFKIKNDKQNRSKKVENSNKELKLKNQPDRFIK